MTLEICMGRLEEVSDGTDGHVSSAHTTDMNSNITFIVRNLGGGTMI